MKAAVLYANEDLRYTDFECPEVVPGTVKVRVRATGICGSDVPRVLHNASHYYPNVLGHEFAGDVVEVGEGVTKVKVGDTISGAPLVPCMQCDDCQKGQYALCKKYSFVGSRQPGSFADYVVIPEFCAVPYDPSIPYTQAAMFEPSTVAIHGVLRNDYKAGGTVAVLGCGTIGIFTLQWAKIFGAKTIIAYDIDEGRLALAKRMGADVCINTITSDYKEETMKATDNKGCDYVFETAGNPITMRMGFDVAANQAHVCFIGTPHVDLTFTPAQWEMMNRKEFKLTGSWMSYSAPYPGKEWDLTAHYFATGQLKFDPEFIFKTYPMSEAADAFACFHNPRDVHGKIMLVND